MSDQLQNLGLYQQLLLFLLLLLLLLKTTPLEDRCLSLLCCCFLLPSRLCTYAPACFVGLLLWCFHPAAPCKSDTSPSSSRRRRSAGFAKAWASWNDVLATTNGITLCAFHRSTTGSRSHAELLLLRRHVRKFLRQFAAAAPVAQE